MDSTAASHPFDEALSLELIEGPGADGTARFVGRTHPAYQNMVGPFGGLLVAKALRGVMLHPAREGTPTAITVNFAAAVADGEYTLEVRPARTNRSTQHWTISMLQRDATGAESTVLTATAMTATRRPTWERTELRRPDVPRVEEMAASKPMRGLPWLARYDFRVVEGNVPSEMDGSESEASTTLYARDEPARPLDFFSLSALCDCYFPRIWRARAKMVPAGTVTITLYFHADEAALEAAGARYILGRATAGRFVGGYFDQQAEVWSEDGTLLATTSQLVYFKE